MPNSFTNGAEPAAVDDNRDARAPARACSSTSSSGPSCELGKSFTSMPARWTGFSTPLLEGDASPSNSGSSAVSAELTLSVKSAASGRSGESGGEHGRDRGDHGSAA